MGWADRVCVKIVEPLIEIIIEIFVEMINDRTMNIAWLELTDRNYNRLVAGFHTEYFRGCFVLIFITEYLRINF